MRWRPEDVPEVTAELRALALAMVGLVAMFSLEHWVVHRQIVLPALEITAEPPLWMWGAMFVPELVVFFAVGWRLRSWLAVIVYAVAGAVTREGFHYLLAVVKEPGHVNAYHDPLSDFAVYTPAIALAYALVLALAAWSGQGESRLVAEG